MMLLGCVTPQPVLPDYTKFREHLPTSILVLPPLNKSTDVGATYSCLSSAAEPIAELGFYVYPVAVVDAMMKENGLPSPGEMHQVPVAKLREVTGADAVMFITIEEYGTTFHLFSSVTKVRLSAKLVDTRTELLLWQGTHEIVEDTDDDSDGSERPGFGERFFDAIFSQIFDNLTNRSHTLARSVNWQLFTSSSEGLLNGPRHAKPGMQERHLIPWRNATFPF
jgi:hypothetical protein